jgi:hypothetical protein
MCPDFCQDTSDVKWTVAQAVPSSDFSSRRAAGHDADLNHVAETTICQPMSTGDLKTSTSASGSSDAGWKRQSRMPCHRVKAASNLT